MNQSPDSAEYVKKKNKNKQIKELNTYHVSRIYLLNSSPMTKKWWKRNNGDVINNDKKCWIHGTTNVKCRLLILGNVLWKISKKRRRKRKENKHK